jgi:hypothetical protein
MQIKHVKIRRFRGIEKLDWSLGKRVVCLVGPNDSTKTTILDAIEYALAPRWYTPFGDTDFYQCKHADGLEIEVTVGELPSELLTDNRFGLDLRGWHPTDGLKDEPDDECEKVLAVRLRVGESLEPQWTVTHNRNPEGRSISWQDRARLGVARLGADTDRHLAWGRGSALARLTEDPENINLAVAQAQRLARKAVADADMAALQSVATKAQEEAKKLGVLATTAYGAKLDLKAIGVGLGAVSLHDGEIPLACFGLGTRRLVSLALQLAQTKDGAVVLIDEIEQGLEPHRLRGLIDQLAVTKGQVIMTSHSPTAIQALGAERLGLVRHPAGNTSVQTLDSEINTTIDEAPEAVLSRKLIVCEGKTEQGLCYAMDCYWSTTGAAESFACTGVAVVYGGGTSAAARAMKWRALGYDVALLGDSDTPTRPDDTALKEAGVTVVRWADNVAVEKRVCRDVPEPALDEVLALAADLADADAVPKVRHALSLTNPSDLSVAAWREAGCQCGRIRDTLSDVAANKRWFKSVEAGRRLGEIIARHLPSIQNSDLAKKLEELRRWAHGG